MLRSELVSATDPNQLCSNKDTSCYYGFIAPSAEPIMLDQKDGIYPIEGNPQVLNIDGNFSYWLITNADGKKPTLRFQTEAAGMVSRTLSDIRFAKVNSIKVGPSGDLLMVGLNKEGQAIGTVMTAVANSSGGYDLVWHSVPVDATASELKIDYDADALTVIVKRLQPTAPSTALTSSEGYYDQVADDGVVTSILVWVEVLPKL